MEKLSIPEKKIAAKIMYKIGWGSRKIEQWLGLSDNTVLRSVEEPTPDNLKQFEAQFEVALVDVRREEAVERGDWRWQPLPEAQAA